MSNIDTSEVQTLRTFGKYSLDGVAGVLRIPSGVPGPVVGVTACTHGNEQAGLTAFDYLFRVLAISKRLQKGTLILAVNNLEAAKRSIRYIDLDMNRLPADMPLRKGDTSYEVKRAQELLPIWRTFDVALDIHSTSLDAPPMIVSLGSKFHADLTKGFPIEIVVGNIDRVQRGKPAAAFYGLRRDMHAIGIEAGKHDSPTAYRCASECVEALLKNLGMLPGTSAPAVKYREYKVISSIVLPDDSYSVVRRFENFEAVPKGEVIAKGSGDDIVMPIDGHTIMHEGNPKPRSITDEVLFVTKPVRLW